MARSERDHVLIGLIGAGIGQSHSPLLHQREADRQGIRLIYTTIDSASRSLDAGDLPDLLRWAPTLGFRGLNVTYPFKQEIVGHLDRLSGEARALGAVNTVVFEEGGARGYNTDWSGFRRSFERSFADAPGNGWCSWAPAGPGRRSRTPCSPSAPATSRLSTSTPTRPSRWPSCSAAGSAPTGSRSASRATCPRCWPRAEGVDQHHADRDGAPPRLAGGRRRSAAGPVGGRHRLPADRHRAAPRRPRRGRARRCPGSA